MSKLGFLIVGLLYFRYYRESEKIFFETPNIEHLLGKPQVENSENSLLLWRLSTLLFLLMNALFVSVIIAAWNSEPTLTKCLNSITKIQDSAFEILVVDDGSTDRTVSIAADYAGVKLLRTTGIGPSAARNIAVKMAQGEFIAFTDSDCIVPQDWLTELRRGMTGEDVAGTGGVQKSPQDETSFARKVHRFLVAFGFMTNYMQTAKSIHEVDHNASCNVMYRRSVYEEFGGFLEGLWPGEDLEFDHRLRKSGRKLTMNPNAVVYHYRAKTFEGFKRMMFRYGWAQGKLMRMHGFFRLIQWLPLMTFSGVIFFFFFPLLVLCLVVLALAGVFILLSFDAEAWNLAMFGFLQWHCGFLKGAFNR